jgi:hypothetical protein
MTSEISEQKYLHLDKKQLISLICSRDGNIKSQKNALAKKQVIINLMIRRIDLLISDLTNIKDHVWSEQNYHSKQKGKYFGKCGRFKKGDEFE